MTRNIQNIIEINNDANQRFHEFKSEIQINELEIQIILKGRIDEELSRINFAMFILELIEQTKFKRIILIINDIEIANESFLELLIEIAIVLLSDNINYNIVLKSKMCDRLIIGRFKEMTYKEKIGNDNEEIISFNKEKILRFSKNNICEKEEVITLWEGEALFSSTNTDTPGRIYRYHKKLFKCTYKR